MIQTIPAWVDDTLTPVEKLEVHERGLRHKAVSVFVMRGDDILLQRRALSKYHTPGLWANTCCTHPGWDEAPRDCALRRLDEELGVTGLDTTHQGRIEYRADVGGGLTEHEVVDLFIAQAPADLDVTPNPDEVAEVRWMDRRALARDVEDNPMLYTPWLRIYMARHAEKLFGPRETA